MGDRLPAGIPFRYVTSQLGQLSLASLRGRLIEVQLRLEWGQKCHTVTYIGPLQHTPTVKITNLWNPRWPWPLWWQVTLCDPIWHVSSHSGVATSRTAIHLLFTYLLTLKLWNYNVPYRHSLRQSATKQALFHVGLTTQSDLFITLEQSNTRKAIKWALTGNKHCSAIRKAASLHDW